jgi:hypothetical protein
MQETQSSTPSAQRTLSPAPSGPLEAAQSYLARQRENEAALAAMDVEERDGRPAWLRRWPREVRNGKWNETGIGSRTSSEAVASEKQMTVGGRSGSVTEPAVLADTSETYTNGYTGHSIEAAFDFETVFNFETELEAEATEDWLDLSGVKSGAMATLDTETDEDGAALLRPEIELRNVLRTELRADGADEPISEQRPSWQGTGSQRGKSASFTAEKPALISSKNFPDPQAVRAAIFRLAQDSTFHRVSGSNLRSEDVETENNPEFAEVARKVWARPLEANQLPEYPIDAKTADSSQPVEADGEGLGRGPNAGKLNVRSSLAGTPHLPPTDHVTSLQGAAEGTFSVNDLPTPDAQASRTATAESFLPRAMNHADVAPERRTTGLSSESYEASWLRTNGSTDQDEATVKSAPSQPLSERQGATELTASMSTTPLGIATEASLQQILQGDVSVTDNPQRPDSAREVAGEAPALAHDAGNLLSALKLYSELLALSGVLHARHKHYAQDLKLLAARSEVLIERLLGCCDRAATPAQRMVSPKTGGSEAVENSGALEAKTIFPAEMSGVTEIIEVALSQSDARADRVTTAAIVAPGLADAITQVSGEYDDPIGVQETATSSPDPVTPATSETVNFLAAVHPRTSQEVGEPFMEVQSLLAESLAAVNADSSEITVPAASADQSLTFAEEVTPINLVDLLTRWGSLLSMIAHGSVAVNFGPHAALPVRVAEEAMERILVNLVHNAMTATRDGGSIRIGVGRSVKRGSVLFQPSSDGLSRPDTKMVLTVDDSGCGMEEAQIAKILGSEQTTSSIRPNGAGGRSRRGMGLQIVRELVSASGGRLAIFSRPGSGTRIEIRWPVFDQASSSKRFPPASAGISGSSLRTGLPHHEDLTNNEAIRAGHAGHDAVQGLRGAVAC